MITFLICLALLVAAYFGYGAYLDRVCKIDKGAAVVTLAISFGMWRKVVSSAKTE